MVVTIDRRNSHTYTHTQQLKKIEYSIIRQEPSNKSLKLLSVKSQLPFGAILGTDKFLYLPIDEK